MGRDVTRLDLGPLTVHRWFDVICTDNGRHKRNRLHRQMELSLPPDAPAAPWPPPGSADYARLSAGPTWTSTGRDQLDPGGAAKGHLATFTLAAGPLDELELAGAVHRTDPNTSYSSHRARCPLCTRDFRRNVDWWDALHANWPADLHEFDISHVRD